MLVSGGLDLDDFKNSYNRTSKANIPKYNIKATKTKDLQPFMSPKHYKDVKLVESRLSGQNSRPNSPKGTTKKVEKVDDKLKKLTKAEEALLKQAEEEKEKQKE